MEEMGAKFFKARMNMKIKCLLLTAFLLGACGKISLSPAGSHDGRPVVIPISLVASPLEEEVKSSVGELALQQINDVHYYLFQNAVLKGQHYFEDASAVEVTLPDPEGTYSLYLLANCGEITVPANTRESEMGTAVHVDFGSMANYRQRMSSGVPMYGVTIDFSASSSTVFTLTRMVHHIVIKMSTEALRKTQMEFTSLRIRQAARDFFPFASESRATAVLDGDEATQDDLYKLNREQSVSFYVLENMRGDLVSANSWKGKIPSAINSPSERSLSTYLELTAKVLTPTATYDETSYRTYLGLSPSNFDLPRNKVFYLRSDFTNEMVESEEWRIEAGDPVITGKLRFVGTKSAQDDVEEFYLMKGFSSVYYVYRSNPDIDFTITADIPSSLSPYVSFQTAEVDEHYTAVMFRTQRQFDSGSYYDYDTIDFTDTEDVTISIRSNDGLLSDSMKCKVLTKPLGARFFYSSGGKLWIQACHPAGLALYVYYSGALIGSVSYKPNGTWGRTQTKTDEIAIANASSPTSPATRLSSCGTPARIDNYRYIYDYERASEGFIEYMNEIWQMTGWDSYTALNGSNGYDKHARPVQLTLDLRLAFTSLDPLHWHPDSDAILPFYYTQQTPHIVYSGTSSEYVAGAGTDWQMFWRHRDQEGGSILDMVYNISTYTVSNGSIVPGYTYQGDDRIPIHVNINGTDNTHRYSLPLTGQFQSIDFYADASNWK